MSSPISKVMAKICNSAILVQQQGSADVYDVFDEGA